MNKLLRLVTPVALAGLVVGVVGVVATPAHAQTVLDHGHIDVFDIDYLAASNSLDVNVRAYAGTGAPGRYDPAQVAIEVAQSFTVPGSWNICATGTAWVLPQQQVSGLVWAGWNTDDVRTGDVPGNQVTINLVSVDNLSGGSDAFCIYTASGASRSASSSTVGSIPNVRTVALLSMMNGRVNW